MFRAIHTCVNIGYLQSGVYFTHTTNKVVYMQYQEYIGDKSVQTLIFYVLFVCDIITPPAPAYGISAISVYVICNQKDVFTIH